MLYFNLWKIKLAVSPEFLVLLLLLHKVAMERKWSLFLPQIWEDVLPVESEVSLSPVICSNYFSKSLDCHCANSFITLRGHAPSMCHVNVSALKASPPNKDWWPELSFCWVREGFTPEEMKYSIPAAEWIIWKGGYLKRKIGVFPSSCQL